MTSKMGYTVQSIELHSPCNGSVYVHRVDMERTIAFLGQRYYINYIVLVCKKDKLVCSDLIQLISKCG